MKNIRFFDADDLCVENIAAFKDINPRFWEYEYKTYMADKAVFIIAKENDTIVGTQALMPYKLNINGRILLSGRSERTKVSQPYRGGKLFPKLMNICVKKGIEKDMELIWGTTHAKTAFQRCGYTYVSNFLEQSLWCIKPFQIFYDLRRKQKNNLSMQSL